MSPGCTVAINRLAVNPYETDNLNYHLRNMLQWIIQSSAVLFHLALRLQALKTIGYNVFPERKSLSYFVYPEEPISGACHRVFSPGSSIG